MLQVDRLERAAEHAEVAGLLQGRDVGVLDPALFGEGFGGEGQRGADGVVYFPGLVLHARPRLACER